MKLREVLGVRGRSHRCESLSQAPIGKINRFGFRAELGLGPLLIISGAMVLLALLGTWRVAHERAAWAQADPVPLSEAQLWMLRALPGIGQVTAPAMCEAVRAGEVQALPKQARPLAAEVFGPWPEAALRVE